MGKTEFCGGHLGFWVAILKIWLGTVAVFDPYTLSLLCANFHAFNTKPTFFHKSAALLYSLEKQTSNIIYNSIYKYLIV